MTVLPVTSTMEPPLPLFRLPVEPSAENGLRVASCVMADKAMSVRTDKLAATIGRLDDADLLRVDRALALFLGIAS